MRIGGGALVRLNHARCTRTVAIQFLGVVICKVRISFGLIGTTTICMPTLLIIERFIDILGVEGDGEHEVVLENGLPGSRVARVVVVAQETVVLVRVVKTASG